MSIEIVRLVKIIKCATRKTSGISTLWRSVPNKGLKIDRASKFHHQERQKQYFLNTAYYDKSCDGKTCHGDLEKISKQFMRIFLKT